MLPGPGLGRADPARLGKVSLMSQDKLPCSKSRAKSLAQGAQIVVYLTESKPFLCLIITDGPCAMYHDACLKGNATGVHLSI
jgi:hypothetical protein